MPTGTCNYPQHHSSGGGFPWGLAVIVAGAVIVATSGAFAEVVHDVMVMVLAAVAAVVVAGLGGLALVLHHQRAMRQHVPERLASVRGTVAAPVPAVPAAARTAALPAAPVVHQHLHLHGLSGGDMTAIVSHHRAIKE